MSDVMPRIYTPPITVNAPYENVDYKSSPLPNALVIGPQGNSAEASFEPVNPQPSQITQTLDFSHSHSDPLPPNVMRAEDLRDIPTLPLSTLDYPPPPRPTIQTSPMEIHGAANEIPYKSASIGTHLQTAPTSSLDSAYQSRGDPSSPITFFVPHGDENTAKMIAQYGASQYRGKTLISKSSSRSLNGISEPNQVFGENTKVPYASELKGQLFGSQNKLIIALHNTHGQALSAETTRSDAMSLKDKNYGGYILTTHPALYQLLKQSPYNVILQNKTTDWNDDNSASRFAAKVGKPYVNIEAVHGDTEKQKQMLDTVMKYVNQLGSFSGQ